MIRLWLILALALLAWPARAEERLVAGLSQYRVALDTRFSGSEIMVFGAIARDAPVQPGDLQVIITVAGPRTPLTVWRKERRFGIWVNAEAAELDAAPSFYAAASSAAWAASVSQTEDLRHHLSIPRAIRAVDAGVSDPAAFTQALIRIRERTGAYRLMPGAVTFTEATLFSTRIELPANLVQGDYVTRIFLTRNGAVVDQTETAIFVRRAGIGQWLYRLATQQPLQYGLLALAIALVAGWGTSTLFRLLRL